MPADTRSSPGAQVFPATQWTVVLAAGKNPSPESAQALERLCQSYWLPLYGFVRRNGYSPSDAEDVTQEFFARLLSHEWLGVAEPSKGRFRTFLLTMLSRFMANEWDRAHAQKRGGRVALVSLDTALGEGRYQAEPALSMSPDRLYDRQWAKTLLAEVLGRLGAEQEAAGKGREFAILSPYLTAERGAIPYRDLAAQLGATESAARMAVHRLRKRFRELFREEIARTVARPEEIDEEIRYLLAALAA